MSADLHIKYRPTRWKDLVGQAPAVKALRGYLDNGGLPHCLLLSGPSGVGKTTAARIIREKMGCGGEDGRSTSDWNEVNCAGKDGPDQVRDIPNYAGLHPVGGKCRIWYLDEVQSLSRAQFCMQSLLKVMEDYPPHAYFILAATDSSKILKPVLTRCKKIDFRTVGHADLVTLVQRVAEAESQPVSDKVAGAVAEAADGSPRQALVLLGGVIGQPEQEQLDALEGEEIKVQAFELAKALLYSKPDPKKVLAVVKGLESEDAEGVRQLILKCCTKEMLKGGPAAAKALAVFSAFRDPYYDTRFAGLVASCTEVLSGGR